jgi:hypothetical protein
LEKSAMHCAAVWENWHQLSFFARTLKLYLRLDGRKKLNKSYMDI